MDKHPIPCTEDLFTSLLGGQRFSKLDLSYGYLQMEVEKSKNLLTISTQKALLCYNHLSFGIASAPALFQKAMDQVLLSLPLAYCYLDDILMSGPDEEIHPSQSFGCSSQQAGGVWSLTLIELWVTTIWRLIEFQ